MSADPGEGGSDEAGTSQLPIKSSAVHEGKGKGKGKAHTTASTSKTKTLNSPICTLKSFPKEHGKEIRKHIFSAIIALHFQEHPKAQVIRYSMGYQGDQLVDPYCPDEYRPLSEAQAKRVFAGHYEVGLPALEVALLAEKELHGEFITTRIEQSTLLLEPMLVADWEGAFESPATVMWPRLEKISSKVRGLVRSVIFSLQ